MQLRYWNFADLQADSLPFPEENELHIWTLHRTDIDNMHKELNSRAILKHILSHYLNVPETAILLDAGTYGKPFLSAPVHEPPIYFNLSHSGDYIVLIFSTVQVGIDIEYMNRNVKIEKMAQRFFHPVEYEALSHLGSRNKKKHFFLLWTIKEAFLKGLGTGLRLPTDSFYATPGSDELYYITVTKQIEDTPVPCTGIHSSKKIQEEYSSWILQTVSAPENYICTIAYRIS